MTLQKALLFLDTLLQKEIKLHDILVNPKKSWNERQDNIHDLVVSFAEMSQQNADILRLIQKNLQVKCSHPKKLRDVDPNGKLYCVGCNQDL